MTKEEFPEYEDNMTCGENIYQGSVDKINSKSKLINGTRAFKMWYNENANYDWSTHNSTDPTNENKAVGKISFSCAVYRVYIDFSHHSDIILNARKQPLHTAKQSLAFLFQFELEGGGNKKKFIHSSALKRIISCGDADA
jgi:hypothetical protein